jgi:hypothetical protein
VKTIRLDELETINPLGTLQWKPVRKALGVTAFGINAYTALNAGDEVVEDHTEMTNGHEEVYVVVSGHAVFTVDGEDVDAPAGTLVFLDDPSQRRAARAREAGTTVLALGAVPGRHEVSVWEYFFPALPHARDGDFRTAIEIVEAGLREKPDHPVLLYQLACFEARAGEPEAALTHLVAAVAGDERCREWARTDEDLDSLRDDPRFPV